MGSWRSIGGTDTGTWQDVPGLLAAAHELKSPLVLIRQLTFQIGEEQAATRIRLTAERSLQLVESLTRAARLQDSLFECEPVYVSRMLEEVAHELMPLSSALGQTIQVHSVKSKPVALANHTLLRTILLGLCDNALTHNDIAKPIVLRAVRSGEDIITSVRDYGPSTSKLSHIRQHIGKHPLPMDGRPRSSGLGLMLAEQFAMHMDGGLQLQRHHEGGVTFSLSLPASQQLSLLPL